jgi:hypothetical protein
MRSGIAIPSETLRNIKTGTIDKLETTPLKYTRYVCGFFLDYFGYPHSPTYMPFMGIVLDMQNHKAAIPGDGEVPVTFTLTREVAKFVAASLDLESWEKTNYIVGDKVKLNDMLKWAEESTGKFDC